MAAAQILPPRYARPERIASGGMGEIFVAEDEVLGRRVAIKLLSERFARDASVRQRFTREALAAAKLSGHPHIVTIFDVGEVEDRPFIVMEYLAGGTLGDRARSGPVDRDAAIEWLRQGADALDEAHRLGIVHRDVKPANLLLDERGELHVADFGIARVLDETATGMTLTGTVLGTAGYLSPEQARGEPATPASDVYGLGVVAYELLTGGRPFEGGSATAEAAAHIHQPVPPASSRGVGLPPQIDAVFGRVLSKEPEHRYGSARDFVRALCLALETEETRIVPPAPHRSGDRLVATPARGDRRRPWIPVLAAVGLAAAAIAGVVVAASLGDDEPERRAASTTEPATSEPREITVTTNRSTTVVRTVTTAPPPPPPPATATTAPPPPPASGSVSLGQAIALTDQATGRMRAGDYAGALPLAQQALATLNGTGHTYEGYANYNVGRSLAELGRCGEAIPYLDRREALLGPPPAVEEARRICGQ